MKLTSIIDVLGQATGAIGAVPAQTPASASLSFSDSLLAASKAPKISGAGDDGSPEVASQQRSACQDATASNATSSHHSALAQIPATQTLLPQHVSPAGLTRSTNPIINAQEAFPEQPASTSDVSTATSDQPMRMVAAPKLTVIESTTTEPNVITTIQLDVFPSSQSMQVQAGAVPIRTGPKSLGEGIRATKATNSPSSKTGNKVSNGVGTVSSGSNDEIQPKPSADEVQNLLLKSFLLVQTTAGTDVSSYATPNPVQTFAPTAFTYGTQGPLPITFLNGAPRTVKSDSSHEQSATLPLTAPNDVLVGVQNPLSNTFLNLQSSAVSDVKAKATQSAEQNTVPKEVRNAQSNTYPYAQSSATQNFIPDGMSNFMRTSAPYASSGEVRNPLNTIVLDPPQEIDPGISSVGTSNAVRSTSAITALNEGQEPSAKTPPNVVEKSVPSVPADAVSKPVPSDTSEGFARGKQDPLQITVFSAPKIAELRTSSGTGRNEV